MTIDTVKTIKIQPWGKGQGDFVEINESDFDPQKHKKYNAKEIPPAPPAPVAVNVPAQAADEPRATAEAIEMAAEAGIDLATIAGSGKNGKITKNDVEAAIEKLTAPESDGE